MRLDATCRVANFEECTPGSFNSGRCAGEPSSRTVKAWVVSGYDVVGNARRRGIPAPAPRPHGNVDGIMDEVKCVAVAPEVGIVGPHARSNKPG